MLVVYIFKQTWDTGEGDYTEKPYDHVEEVASVSQPDLSAKAQIICTLLHLIFKDSTCHRHQLSLIQAVICVSFKMNTP